MVSRYRRECASPLHLRDRNCTYTLVKLSKTITGQSLPSLISRSFRENGSHRFVIVDWGAGDSQKCRQIFIVIQQVVIRLSKCAIGFDRSLLELLLDPFSQPPHDRATLGLVILEPLPIAHPSRQLVVQKDDLNRRQHMVAFLRKNLFQLLELSVTVRQVLPSM